MFKNNVVLIRGGGDLATGVALRLYRSGMRVVITELTQPLAVRRTVAFSEAVYEGSHTVEGVTARLVNQDQIMDVIETGEIPVLIDPSADILSLSTFPVVVDARLIKTPQPPLPISVPLHIGLGPGFTAGSNCHAVIETRRSHTLGRVYWTGTSQPDSGEPEGDRRRVMRAPGDGTIQGQKNIGDLVEEGEVIAEIESEIENHKSEIQSPFAGILRGLIRSGLHVTQGLKIGDVDARNDVSTCYLVSDKALAIGGGVLEAILSKSKIRGQIFS
jgi:xanthine dehydrogenase accessory factor